MQHFTNNLHSGLGRMTRGKIRIQYFAALQRNDKVGNFLMVHYFCFSSNTACPRFCNDDNGQLKDNGSKKGGNEKENI